MEFSIVTLLREIRTARMLDPDGGPHPENTYYSLGKTAQEPIVGGEDFAHDFARGAQNALFRSLVLTES
jgi:hypothetical protein